MRQANRGWMSGPWARKYKEELFILVVQWPWVSKDEIIKFSGPLWSSGGLGGCNNRFFRFSGRGIFLPHQSYRNTTFIQAESIIILKVSQLLEEIWSEKQS